MSDKELLDAFADYLDAALNMDLGAQIAEILNVKDNAALLRCHRYAQQAYNLRFHRDAFPLNPERTKEKALTAVKSYSTSRTLQGMTRKDYCSFTTERSFERAALGALFGFLQIKQTTR